jgi:hypothetical protein
LLLNAFVSLTVAVWLAIAVVGSIPGGALIFIYERWSIKHGNLAWNVSAWKNGEVQTPSWRKLWWWVLLSYLLMFTGIMSGVILQK